MEIGGVGLERFCDTILLRSGSASVTDLAVLPRGELNVSLPVDRTKYVNTLVLAAGNAPGAGADLVVGVYDNGVQVGVVTVLIDPISQPGIGYTRNNPLSTLFTLTGGTSNLTFRFETVGTGTRPGSDVLLQIRGWAEP